MKTILIPLLHGYVSALGIIIVPSAALQLLYNLSLLGGLLKYFLRLSLFVTLTHICNRPLTSRVRGLRFDDQIVHSSFLVEGFHPLPLKV